MKYLLNGVETDRLKFRLLKESDFEEWQLLFYEENVAKFLLLPKNLTPKELCEKWFEKVLNRYKNDLGGLNVLIDKSTQNFVGQCGLLIQNIEGIEYLEVGYSMLPKFWNKGYATEAAIKCRDFAFENNFTESLISLVHKENIGSERVAIKNGMKVYLNTMKPPQQDFNMFRITKLEWKNLTNPRSIQIT